MDTLSPPFLPSGESFFGPQVNQVLHAGLFTNTSTFFGPQVNQVLHAGLFTNANTFGGTDLISQALQPARLANTNAFFAPSVVPLYGPAYNLDELFAAFKKVWLQGVLSTRGANDMENQLKILSNYGELPGLGILGDEKTGIGAPRDPATGQLLLGQLWFKLFGHWRFLFAHQGLGLRDLHGRTGWLRAVISEARAWDLPDESGELGLDRLHFTAENGDTDPIVPGMAVITDVSGALLRASDPDIPLGLAVTGAAPGDPLTVRVGGLFELEDWTDIVGAADLSAATEWYLDVDGQLVSTPGTPHVLSRVTPTMGRIR